MEFIRNIGFTAAMEPEFWGFYGGLNMTWSMGYNWLVVEVDTLGEVQMLRGSPKAPQTNSLAQAILGLLKREWQVKVVRIYWEGNMLAKR